MYQVFTQHFLIVDVKLLHPFFTRRNPYTSKLDGYEVITASEMSTITESSDPGN